MVGTGKKEKENELREAKLVNFVKLGFENFILLVKSRK